MIAKVAETLALCTRGGFICAPRRYKFAQVWFGPKGSALTLRCNQKWPAAAGRRHDLFCPGAFVWKS